jgi:hypothetical protein
MLLVFRILKSSSIACTPTYTDVTLATDFKMNLVIDNEVIVSDSVIFNTLSLPIAATTTDNGYNVNLSVATGFISGTYYTISIDLPSISSHTLVQIKLSVAGCAYYENEFVVFGYDLGSNPNVPVSGTTTNSYPTPNMDILLGDTNGVAHQGKINIAQNKFIAYRRPFTDEIYVYNLSSADSTQYFTSLLVPVPAINNHSFQILNNGVVVANTRNTVINSLIKSDIEHNLTLYELDGVTVDSVCNKTQTVPVHNDVLKIQGYTSCPACQDDCAVYNANLSLYANLSFIDLDTFIVDNVVTVPSNTYSLVYEVFNFDGILVFTETVPITGVSGSFVYDPLSYGSSVFTLGTVGEYLIRTTIVLTSVYSNSVVNSLKGCEVIKVDLSTCGTTVLVSKSITDLIVTLYKLDDNKDFILVSTNTLLSLGSLSLTTEDGIYKIVYTYSSVVKTAIFVVDCGIRDCILSLIQKILCDDGCGCDDCTDENLCANYYNFNVLMLLYNTYISLYDNDIEYISHSYTEDYLQDILQLSDVLAKLKKHCKICSSDNPCKPCSE